MPLISFIIGVSLLPLKRSSVALMLPANDCKSNSSDSSSEISDESLLIEKLVVRSSLKVPESQIVNLKLDFKYL